VEGARKGPFDGIHVMKDTNYYNQESTSYSRKRYPERETDYVQFFFKRRLQIVLGMLGNFLEKRDARVALLEVGIADGVVLRSVYDAFGPRLARVEGNDIAPEMVAAAKAINGNRPISYAVREGSALPAGFDIVLEVGVLNYAPWQEDIKAAYDALRPGGIYICSIAGRGSLRMRLKGGEETFTHFLDYKEYEDAMAEGFAIEERRPCGFFVPLIWRVPALALTVQPAVEFILSSVVPRMAHEYVYVLRKQ
jgi:SAM-dependent methyltransferase